MIVSLPRGEALNIFRIFKGITSSATNSISFKANYAIEKNIRVWFPQIVQIEKSQKELIDKLPEGFAGETGISNENFAKPECKDLRDFLDEKEDFETHKFDGEGLNSEQNKWQSFVSVLYPIFNDPL
jgi:hypothetical protein